MKVNKLIFIIISILGISLFLSTMYDKKVNATKIALYQCENNAVIPFPKEYLKPHLQESFNAKEHHYKITKALELNWKKEGLIDLPSDIFKKYPCIKSLDISENFFTKIPDAINDLTDLQHLSLDNNNITSAKNDTIDYKQFKNLKFINLSNNLIETLDYIPMTSTFFDFIVSNNKIKEVSFINTSNRFLNSLDLSNNDLKEFPYDFYRLRNLVELNISRNSISGGIELRGLEELETLNISNQQSENIRITSVTIDEKSCLELVNLEAQNNDISSFMLNYSQGNTTNKSILNQLENINFRGNKFTSFPSLIYKCTNLRSLDLSKNELGDIMFSSSISMLDKLYLQHNKIKKIDKLNNIRYVSNLDLSHNELSEFPFFNDHDYLEELNLSHNNIESLAYFLENNLTTRRFMKIDLSHNQITTFNETNKKHNALQELNLSNNKIRTFHCNQFQKLRTLDLSNNDLKEITWSETSSYKELKELNLSNNPNLEDIPTELFNTSSVLRVINIKNTNLNSNLILFLTQYCRTNGIQLIK